MRNILFVCTGNSARSIMAEAYMNHAGHGRWRAYSAGSKPTGQPHSFAIKTLRTHNLDIGTPRSKSWDEFAADAPGGAPPMDVVVTVCDNAAGETCPLWPTAHGRPTTVYHWPFPDPAAAQGDDTEITNAFAEVFENIRMKIDTFLAVDDGTTEDNR